MAAVTPYALGQFRAHTGFGPRADVFIGGSPGGNGAHHGRYLQPGDLMEATITGGIVDLGTQHNRCVQP